MNHISHECFVFNDIIEDINSANNINDSTVVNKLLLNNINKNYIKNIVNKISTEYDVSIKNIDNGIGITIIFYYGDLIVNIIELKCNDNIIDIYLNYASITNITILSKCIIQILNYLKDIICININDIIKFNTFYDNDGFYLRAYAISYILALIENNYKIKLVSLDMHIDEDKIDKLKIEMFKNDKTNISILIDNIINIDEDTEIPMIKRR